MSGTGEGAEWKFWRIPELVERLLLFLDTGSTSRLAKVHPLTMEILQSPLGWRKLLRKSFPCDRMILPLEQHRVEIQHLIQILKSMEDPKLPLLDLLDVICHQSVPMTRDGGFIQVSCPSLGHTPHSVSPFCFSLLEEVEQSLGTAEQAIKEIQVHKLENTWLSALSSRAARQEGMVMQLYAYEVVCKSPEEAVALHNLLRRSQNVSLGQLHIEGEIGEEGWAEIAKAVRLPIRVREIRSPRHLMQSAKKADLKTIWDALEHGWLVDLSEGSKWLFKGYSYEPSFICCCLVEYSPKKEDRKMWSRLKQLLKEDEGEGSH